MHDVVLTHVVEWDQDLDGKPLDQTQWKALEVIHLDEVVEVDTEQFKCQNQMFPENKMVKPFHNILLIFWIISIQSFNELWFNQALLIQPSLILQDLQSHKLLIFMVEDAQDDAEWAFAQFFDDLVAIA